MAATIVLWSAGRGWDEDRVTVLWSVCRGSVGAGPRSLAGWSVHRMWMPLSVQALRAEQRRARAPTGVFAFPRIPALRPSGLSVMPWVSFALVCRTARRYILLIGRQRITLRELGEGEIRPLGALTRVRASPSVDPTPSVGSVGFGVVPVPARVMRGEGALLADPGTLGHDAKRPGAEGSRALAISSTNPIT